MFSVKLSDSFEFKVDYCVRKSIGTKALWVYNDPSRYEDPLQNDIEWAVVDKLLRRDPKTFYDEITAIYELGDTAMQQIARYLVDIDVETFEATPLFGSPGLLPDTLKPQISEVLAQLCLHFSRERYLGIHERVWSKLREDPSFYEFDPAWWSNANVIPPSSLDKYLDLRTFPLLPPNIRRKLWVKKELVARNMYPHKFLALPSEIRSWRWAKDMYKKHHKLDPRSLRAIALDNLRTGSFVDACGACGE